jgi:hypothetical protein
LRQLKNQLESLFLTAGRGGLGGLGQQAHHLAAFAPCLAGEVLATLPDPPGRLADLLGDVG